MSSIDDVADEDLALTESGVWMVAMLGDTEVTKDLRFWIANKVLPAARRSGLLARLMTESAEDYPQAAKFLAEIGLADPELGDNPDKPLPSNVLRMSS